MRFSRTAFLAIGLCLIAASVSFVGGQVPPLPGMPDTTPQGKPHFDKFGPQAGDQLPSLAMVSLEGKERRLSEAWGGRPILLLTSSFTCPKSRSEYPKAAALAAKYGVGLAVVYIIEAHPSGDPSPYSGVEDVTNENHRDGVLCAQPRTIEQRLALAARFQKRLNADADVFVDAMDNAAWKSLGGGPNMAFLVDQDGIVLARQGWFDAPSMEKAVDSVMAALIAESQKPKNDWELGDWDTIRPTQRGELATVKAQLAKTPGLATKVFGYMGRGNEGDMTLLQYAAARAGASPSHLEIARLLIDAGADVNLQTEHKPAPLILAAGAGNLQIARLLIDHKADVNARARWHGPTALQEALLHKHADVADLLIKSGAHENFFCDVAMGNKDAVQAAITRDASVVNRPDGSERTPLCYAAAAGKLDIARVLLDADARDQSPQRYWQREACAIYWAVAAKDVPMVRLLCDNGSDANLLDEAIYAAAPDVARELLAHKADPNLQDVRGWSPLHLATAYDCDDIVAMLLTAGADPNAKTGDDHSPCGDPFNDLDSPLHFAGTRASARAAALLLRRGAEVNQPNAQGRTPLHSAASSYKPPAEALAVVTALVNAGANINAKDTAGKTPLDLALAAANDQAAKHDAAVVNYLMAHGAKKGVDTPGPNADPAKQPPNHGGIGGAR